MTDSRDKSDPIGATAKKELAKAYAFSYARIEENIESKYFEKGHKREEVGITYYALKKGVMLKKNEIRLFDDVCTGLPDIEMFEDENGVKILPDIKNAFSYTSYLKTITEPIAKDRYWQGQTYMRLTGADEAHFVVCCINAPIEMIGDERRRAMFKMGVSDEEDPAYIEKCLKIERSMIFDMNEFNKEYPHAELYTKMYGDLSTFVNIPWEKRISIMKVKRCQSDIDLIEKKAPIWRTYIENTFINPKTED